VFALLLLDQSPLSIAIYALVFGATFLVTAPLTVVFVRDHFGTRNLGAISGLITMVHQLFGGLGAYGGALVFDATGGYDAVFVLMLVASTLAIALALMLRSPPR
jgi:predicted MFS family arabinose efflux permease